MAKYELGDMIYGVKENEVFNGFVASIIVKPACTFYGIRTLDEELDICFIQVNETACFLRFEEALEYLSDGVKERTKHIKELFMDSESNIRGLSNHESTIYQLTQDLPKAIACLTE
jgi:hypothetical protein